MDFSALPIFIRRAQPADLDAVWALCTTVKRQLAQDNIPIWDDAYPTRAFFAEDIAQGGLLVAVRGGAIIGSVNYSADLIGEYFFDVPNPQAQCRAMLARCGAPEENTVSMHRLMVDPTARHSGAAQALLHAAEQQNAGKWILLFAAGYNQPACRLYEKLGYADLGEYSFSFGAMRYLVKAPDGRRFSPMQKGCDGESSRSR